MEREWREKVSGFKVNIVMNGLVGWENQQLSFNKVNLEVVVLQIEGSSRVEGKDNWYLHSSGMKNRTGNNWSQHRSLGGTSDYWSRGRETGHSFSLESDLKRILSAVVSPEPLWMWMERCQWRRKSWPCEWWWGRELLIKHCAVH